MNFLQSELQENLSTERKRNGTCSFSTRDFQMLRSLYGKFRRNGDTVEETRVSVIARSADAEEKQERRNCYYVSFRGEYLYSAGAFRW